MRTRTRQSRENRLLSVSPGVEVDAAHFLEAEVGADGRGGRPVRLEDSGFQAHGAGISQAFGHQRGIDPLATVGVERGRALHHRDGALGERKPLNLSEFVDSCS